MISASFILALLFAVVPPDMQLDAPMRADDTDISEWVVLRITSAGNEDDSYEVVLTPPPGVYPFQRGDHVVLCAFGRDNRPRVVRWSGDTEEVGRFLYLEMDTDKTIHASCDRVAHDIQTNTTQEHWFDAPEGRAVHVFVGGGNLYGWFTAKRAQTHGVGITHLTHQDVPHLPLLHGTGLNLEHIFSGRTTDAGRALYTPRTDPVRFRIEAPNAVRVLWPAETSSWSVDCDMRYVFPGGDALDIEFSATPGVDEDSPEYIVFMWASYHNQSSDRALYFPGIQNGVEEWVRYGPVSEDGKAGGIVAHRDARPLSIEDGYNLFNLSTSKEVFFTTPFYYGIIDERTVVGQAGTPRIVLMMFDRHEPIHFAIYNWGYPPTISAWDWQYVLHDPQPGKSEGYRARMLYTGFKDKETAVRSFDAWRESTVQLRADGTNRTDVPELPHYWSPAFSTFDIHVLAEALETDAPDLALTLWRLALLRLDTRQTAADALDRIHECRGDGQARIREWEQIIKKETAGAVAFLHGAKAFHDHGDIESALLLIAAGVNKFSGDGSICLYRGRLLLEQDDLDEGLDNLLQAVVLDKGLAKEAADIVAARACNARQAADYPLAERLYRISTDLAPDDLWHQVYLGETLEARGRDDEALALYQKVLLTAPESPRTARNLDALYLRHNNQDGRLAFWRTLHEHHAEAVLPILYLGKALEAVNDLKGAGEAYRAVHTCDPDLIEARELLEALRKRTGVVCEP